MASREGFRAYARYTDGDFEPELTSTALRRWWSHCWSAAPIMSAYHSEEVRPYAATFLAFAFAGGASAMGIAGPCGDIPDCPKCPLQADCRWQTLRERSDLTGQETLALARSGQVQHLRTDQLIQALLPAGGEDARRLLRTLGDTPLRALAGLLLPQLAERVGGAEFLPEQLTLLFELCKRFNEERMAVGVAFQTPWDIFRHFRMRLRDQKQEQFIVVLLDNRKRYLNDVVISQGTLNASPVHPRDVFNAAIRERAASVVVVHNHPSGDPKPSREDIHVTQQLIKVGELVGIPIVDHIIIADEQYVSMLEQGLLRA